MVQVAERYWDRIGDSKNPYNFRLKIVMFYRAGTTAHVTMTSSCSLRASVSRTTCGRCTVSGVWTRTMGEDNSCNVLPSFDFTTTR